ncbi:1-aminocyclopropane-1-carboxylate synthase-like protein 1 [Aplochiton taeniatus]
MGTSQNNLCYDLLNKRLIQPDMLHFDPALLKYPNWKGHRFLREEVANFLSHYCQAPSPLKADNVVVMNGCGSLFSSIAAAVCDPEDAFLIPTPFYGVITNYLRLYSDVRLFHVDLDCEDFREDSRCFHLTVAHLEEALQEAKTKGVNIRGLILVNPHNPLAEVHSPQEIRDFLEFAKRHELHVIVDEVYMLTVFDESATFQSVLSLDRLPDPQRTHVLWGMSKDFAMPGLRLSAVYTENRDLVEALDKLASFHGVSGITQHQVARVLHDRDWISGEFLPENRRRLQAAHRYLTGELQTLGVPYLHSPAGLYVWADFRKYLRESSFSEELSLWRCFLRHKVVLIFGQFFSCSTPGWFRIVFTDQQDRLQLGQSTHFLAYFLCMERIGKALKEMTQLLQDSDYLMDNEEKRTQVSCGMMKVLELGDPVTRFRLAQSCVGLGGCLGVSFAVWTPQWLGDRGLWTKQNDTDDVHLSDRTEGIFFKALEAERVFGVLSFLMAVSSGALCLVFALCWTSQTVRSYSNTRSLLMAGQALYPSTLLLLTSSTTGLFFLLCWSLFTYQHWDEISQDSSGPGVSYWLGALGWFLLLIVQPVVFLVEQFVVPDILPELRKATESWYSVSHLTYAFRSQSARHHEAEKERGLRRIMSTP